MLDLKILSDEGLVDIVFSGVEETKLWTYGSLSVGNDISNFSFCESRGSNLLNFLPMLGK